MGSVVTQRLEGTGGENVEFEGAAEKAVAEVTGVTTDITRREVSLIATASWVAGATSETITIKIRRGSGVAGTVVGEITVSSVAGKKNECSIQCSDTPGEAAGLAYTLTMTESKVGEKDKSVKSRIRAEC